jgi:hypothetical protein
MDLPADMGDRSVMIPAFGPSFRFYALPTRFGMSIEPIAEAAEIIFPVDVTGRRSCTSWPDCAESSNEAQRSNCEFTPFHGHSFRIFFSRDEF